MSDGANPLAVDEIRHKVLLMVDEMATEAAATAVTMIGAAPPPKLALDVRADHPFLLAVRDIEREAILFLASIQDPDPP